jgi:hypothetical protein
MVSVATKSTNNVIHNLGSTINSSFLQSFVSKLDMPIKLIVLIESSANRPYILGLGDIALPGLLLRLAYFIDYEQLVLSNKIDTTRDIDSVNKGYGGISTNSVAISSIPAQSQDLEDNNALLPPNHSPRYVLPLLLSFHNFKIFYIGLLGYTLGLYSAFLAHGWFSKPQPALLYIVPFTLASIIGSSMYCNVFNKLWNGPKLKSYEENR